MFENEKISVVIPVYKVEKYLKECIDSVRNQTYDCRRHRGADFVRQGGCRADRGDGAGNAGIPPRRKNGRFGAALLQAQ